MPVSLSRHGGEGIDDDVEASEIIANQVERVFDEHGNVRPEERSGRIRLAYYRRDLVPSVHRLGAKRPAGAAGPPDDLDPHVSTAQCPAGIPESCRELGPDVFFGDRTVDPLGDSDHAASAFELSDDAGPLP